MTTKKKTNTKAKKPSKKKAVKAKAEQSQSYDGSKPLKDKRREAFCREYIISLNGSDAARKAKYSPKGANVAAIRLLTNATVQKRIEFLKTQNVERVKNDLEYEITADRVLKEVAMRAYANIADFITFDAEGKPIIDLSTVPREKMAGLKAFKFTEVQPIKIVEMGIEIERDTIRPEVTTHDNARYLEMLMKHLGLVTEKVEVEGLGDLVAELQKGRERVAKGCENV